MKPDRPGTGPRAEECSNGPRLGLCQLLEQRRADGHLSTPSAQDPAPQLRAKVIRFPVTRLTRQI